MATYEADKTIENEKLLKEELTHMSKMDRIFGEIKS